MSHLLGRLLLSLCVASLYACDASEHVSPSKVDAQLSPMDSQVSMVDAGPVSADAGSARVDARLSEHDATRPAPDSALVPPADASSRPDAASQRDAMEPRPEDARVTDSGTIMDATGASDLGVVDAAAPMVDAAAPMVDAAAPMVDAAAPMVDAAAPMVDAAAPMVDAAAPVVDAGQQVDRGIVNPQQDAGAPAEPEEYRGLGLVPVESSMYLTPRHLELSAQEEMYVSFLVRRLLPRAEGFGDTSHLQPWLMYKPGEGPEWRWLLVGFYLPENEVARLPADDQRVQAGRTGPWHRRVAGRISPIGIGEVGAALADPAAQPLCGGAILSARFTIRLADQGVIENVVGVVMTVSRNDQLDLGWLRGCGRDALP
jgi:hypothetical protein